MHRPQKRPSSEHGVPKAAEWSGGHALPASDALASGALAPSGTETCELLHAEARTRAASTRATGTSWRMRVSSEDSIAMRGPRRAVV